VLSWVGGALLGFITANILNLVELGILLRVMKDIKKMLNQFKSEGKSEEWLR
jgi:hypothetical protein